LANGEGKGAAVGGSVIVRKRVPGMTAFRLAGFVARAKRAVKLSGGVSVLIAGNRELRVLNRRFRGKDRATDVLSFPPVPACRPDFAGDLAISAELAAANGHRLGHSAQDEIKILLLHGLLHLAGYDHERDNGEMARKEQRLRKSLGLPVGLIERSRQSAAPKRSKAQPTGRGERRATRRSPSKRGLAGSR
jgi:probable rRNA maturation factor